MAAAAQRATASYAGRYGNRTKSAFVRTLERSISSSRLRAYGARTAEVAEFARTAEVAEFRPFRWSAPRCFSTDPRSASERVHGAIDPDAVKSKAMRAKLLKQQQQQQQRREGALLPGEDEEMKRLRAYEVEAGPPPPPPPPAGDAPSFGSVMLANVLSGAGVAVGFMIVGLVVRSVFGGGGGGAAAVRARPPAPPQPPPSPAEAWPLDDTQFDREEQSDDPYARRPAFEPAAPRGGGRTPTSL